MNIKSVLLLGIALLAAYTVQASETTAAKVARLVCVHSLENMTKRRLLSEVLSNTILHTRDLVTCRNSIPLPLRVNENPGSIRQSIDYGAIKDLFHPLRIATICCTKQVLWVLNALSAHYFRVPFDLFAQQHPEFKPLSTHEIFWNGTADEKTQLPPRQKLSIPTYTKAFVMKNFVPVAVKDEPTWLVERLGAWISGKTGVELPFKLYKHVQEKHSYAISPHTAGSEQELFIAAKSILQHRPPNYETINARLGRIAIGNALISLYVAGIGIAILYDTLTDKRTEEKRRDDLTTRKTKILWGAGLASAGLISTVALPLLFCRNG